MATTFIFPQYAFNLMSNLNKNKCTLSKSSIISQNLPIIFSPIFANLMVSNTTRLWKNNIGTLYKVHTINEQLKFGFSHTMFNRSPDTKKRNLLIEATSSSKNDHNNDEHKHNILTENDHKNDVEHEHDHLTCKKCVEYHNTQVAIIGITTLIMSTANKIFYKMALVQMKNYPFFLAQVLTFGYVTVYSSALFYRYKTRKVTQDMLNIPKRPFILIGFLEALGLAIGMAAASHLPGASIPILNQVYLVWQLVFSTTILKKKYSLGQIVGCLLVIIGVIIAITSEFKIYALEESGFFWPMILIISSGFAAAASIIKEFVFLDSKKRLQGKPVDIFVVNTCGSTVQASFVLLLLPILSHLQGIRVHDLPRYLKEGFKHFINCSSLGNRCYGASLVPSMYILINLSFNILNLSLLKESSAVVTSLCTTLSLPVSIWAFTFNLPLLGTPTVLPQGLYVGTLVLSLGLLVYNFLGKKNINKEEKQ